MSPATRIARESITSMAVTPNTSYPLIQVGQGLVVGSSVSFTVWYMVVADSCLL